MKTNQHTSPLISATIRSDTAGAKYKRGRSLCDDKYRDRVNKQSKITKAKKRIKSLHKDAEARAHARTNGFLSIIRHHLERGRSAADIAIREGWMMSRVLAGIAEVSK